MRRLSCLAAGLAASVLFAAVAAAADLVVIRSSVPGVKRGTVIQAGTELDIPAGKSLTLISPTGKPETIKGPFKGKVGAGAARESEDDSRLVVALAKLVEEERDTGALGAMRAVRDASGQPDDPWVINVSVSATYCVAGGQSARLWRADAGKKGALSLRQVPLDRRIKLSWPAGEQTLAWPDDLTLEDGATYLAQLKGSLNATRFDVRFVPDDLATDAHRAVWMAEKGCEMQASLLLDTLE